MSAKLQLAATQSNGKRFNTDPARPGISHGAHDRRIQVILILLEQNSRDHLAIADIAGAVNLSPGRLAHLFKSEVGVSLQQYLTQVRVAKAKHQLETTFLSIKEIAAATGFPSVTRFGASFKQAMGMTPSDYRKRRTGRNSANEKDLLLARSANR